MTSILLIRPSALGDVCRTVPVLVSLRQAYPDAKIDWLIRDTFADAVRSHPALNGIVEMKRRQFSDQLKRLQFRDFRRWMADLSSRRYDIALDCQGLFRSGFFAWASGAPRRIGLSNAREFGWIWLNERHHVTWDYHAVDRMLELTRLSGIEPVRDMRLYTSAKDRGIITPDLAGKSFALIAPTSSWPGKQWPADRFAKVISWLLAESRVERVVIVGAPSERAAVQPLLDHARTDTRILDRVGATSIGQLMALVEASSFVLANDSAALHMAVGFNRPAVGLYGPTRIHEDGPYDGHNPSHPVKVIQHLDPSERISPKDAARAAALMQRITVEEVQQAITSLALPEGGGRRVGSI